MAITYPGAAYRQLSGKSRSGFAPRVINVHTMVGTLAGTESWFSGSDRAYSHFGVGGDGEVWQWQDLSYRAASDLDGNSFCVSIETEDHGPGFPTWSGSDVPRWTPAQASALVDLISWLCDRFDIPRRLLSNSLPGQSGISYHRLGIDPWRAGGGVRYSRHFGKVCPGDRRIAQLRDEVVPRLHAEKDDDMTPSEHTMLANTHHLVGQTHGHVNTLADKVGAIEFIVSLLWQLNTPNGTRYVDPTTGQLVSGDTPGAKPVVDVWRWAREAAIAARAEPDAHAELENLIDQLKALHGDAA